MLIDAIIVFCFEAKIHISVFAQPDMLTEMHLEHITIRSRRFSTVQ